MGGQSYNLLTLFYSSLGFVKFFPIGGSSYATFALESKVHQIPELSSPLKDPTLVLLPLRFVFNAHFT